MNMFTFDGVQPEELLALLRNFKIAIDGIGTTTPTGRINYLCTVTHGKSLSEFDELSLQGDTTKKHLKHITEGLLEYPPSPPPPPIHFSRKSVQ